MSARSGSVHTTVSARAGAEADDGATVAAKTGSSDAANAVIDASAVKRQVKANRFMSWAPLALTS
jgi:hypothetical protein